jgi:Tol biopolymer transport system component
MKLRWAVAVIAAAAFGAVPAFAAPAVSHGSAIGPTLTKLAYTSNAVGQADIYTMDSYGKNVFNVSHDKTIGVRADVEPVWSPTGDRVAFERQYVNGGAAVMIANADGSDVHALAPSLSSRVWSCHPSWADNDTVFFTSNRDGNFDLYSVMASGKALRQLTKTSAPVQNLGPAISPDGKTLVFSRKGAPWGGNGLYLLKLGTGALVHLTADWQGQTYFDPAWSLNGAQIAFASNLKGSNDIWLIGALSTSAMRSPVQLTFSKYSDVHPAFSPDGRRIAFVSDRTGTTQIYTMPAQVSAVPLMTQLTFDKAFKADPSWHIVTIGPYLAG